jgi:tetratricopeptide (TPR) repeat protein
MGANAVGFTGTMSSTQPAHLELLATGNHVALLESHLQLEAPTPEQEAWAGWACAHLGRFIESSEYLNRARARGFETAAALLANVYAFSGETQRAFELLEGILEDQLDPVGQAMFERAQGVVAFEQGHLDRAVTHVQRAWDLASGLQAAGAFLPGIARLTGHILTEAGLDHRAIPVFDRALETSNPTACTELLAARAFAFTNLGRFERAADDLSAIQAEHVTPAYKPFLLYIKAEWNRARGVDEEATTQLLDLIEVAQKGNALEVEAFAHLSLCALATGSGAIGMARSYLARARRLIPASNPSANALLALRHGALLNAANDDEASTALTMALTTFEQLGMEREAGMAAVHLAEACLRRDDEYGTQRALVRATDSLHAIGSGARIAIELRGLPNVLEFLATLKPGAYPLALLLAYRKLQMDGTSVVQIKALGGYGLSLDGASVRLDSGLARTVEVLAYLLENGPSELEQIQACVWQDTPPQSANKRFQHVRSEVKRHLAGVLVAFDKHSRLYQVKAEGVRLEYDVREVRQALAQTGERGLLRALLNYTGPFLPKSEGEWAYEQRYALEWDIAKAGLVTVEDLFKQGLLDRAERLARRLLEIRLDASIANLFLMTVSQLHGIEAARQELERLKVLFVQEIGVVPEQLEQIRDWRAIN